MRALILAAAFAASAVGYASYIQGPEPGADIRVPKQVFVKDQARICPFDATEFTGCDR